MPPKLKWTHPNDKDGKVHLSQVGKIKQIQVALSCLAVKIMSIVNLSFLNPVDFLIQIHIQVAR